MLLERDILRNPCGQEDPTEENTVGTLVKLPYERRDQL